DVALRIGFVVEMGHDGVSLREAADALAQGDLAGSPEQDLLEVGAVHADDRPLAPRGVDLAEDSTVARAYEERARDAAAASNLVADAQTVESGERVRREREAGTDLFERRRLLVELDLVAGAPQRDRRGEPADTPADDERLHLLRRWQLGQYQVPRPAERIFSIGVPQRGHGSPSRP